MDAQAAGTDKGTKKCKFEIDQLFSSQLMSCRALVHSACHRPETAFVEISDPCPRTAPLARNNFRYSLFIRSLIE